ncbi:MAG: hypothetical protein M3Y39_11635 [Chloroflexota bacterium]|nr:hypothetical protein [Chloroflexota bacterium]
MIDDYPNLRQGQAPEPPKLVLPGLPEDAPYPGAYTQRVYVHPDQMRLKPPSRLANPFTMLGQLWRRDPAYKVLIVAAGTVLLAGIIFAVFLVSMFAQAASTTPTNTTGATTSSKAASNPPPAFPTPSGGKGNKGNSQPPKSATPVVLPTLTPVSTPTPQPTQATFNPQIVSIPQQVHSNTTVPVTISVGQPGVAVRLQVTYDQAPNMNTSGPATTDANGNVTLNWHVSVFTFKQHLVARVTAFATNQNGQQVQTQTVSVAVVNRFRFG